MPIHVSAAMPSDAPTIARLVGELLREITDAIGRQVFAYSLVDTEARARLAGGGKLYGAARAKRRMCRRVSGPV